MDTNPRDIQSQPGEKDWPHAPIHRLDTNGVYIITAGTHYKRHLYNSPEKLTLLEARLLTLAKQSEWQLEAWAVFSNHYHFVARSLPGATDLGQLIRRLHAVTARALNRLEPTEGRAVRSHICATRLADQYSHAS